MKKTLTFLLLVVLASLSSALALDSYYGLFSDSTSTNGVTIDRAGYFSFARSNTAEVVSGRLYLDGRVWAFKGGTNKLFYDADPVAITIKRPMSGQSNVTLRLFLPGDGSDTISGTVSNEDGSWVSELSGYRQVPTPDYEGNYTVAFAGSTNPAVSPAGDGSGFLTIDAGGVAKLFGGKLADGTVITQKVPLSKHGEWPLFCTGVPFATNGGKAKQELLMGWVNVSNGFSAPNLVWIRNPVPVGTVFTNGFNNQQVELLASRYLDTPPTTEPVLGLSNGSCVVYCFDGGVTDVLTNYFTLTNLNAKNRFVSASKTNKFMLSLTPVTGKLTGSFIDPANSNRFLLTGVVLTNQNVGRGFILNRATLQYGGFILQPAE